MKVTYVPWSNQLTIHHVKEYMVTHTPPKSNRTYENRHLLPTNGQIDDWDHYHFLYHVPAVQKDVDKRIMIAKDTLISQGTTNDDDITFTTQKLTIIIKPTFQQYRS